MNKHNAKQVMPVAWNPTRWQDWCLPKNGKKETEAIFTDKFRKCLKLVEGVKMLLLHVVVYKWGYRHILEVKTVHKSIVKFKDPC